MKWNIVTDSSCDLREADVKSEAVSYSKVPFFINIGGKEYVDDDNIDTLQMLEDMKKSMEASSSACPSPGAWYEKFKEGHHNIFITISKKLSGSFGSAEAAKEMIEKDRPDASVFTIDSRSTGPALVLIMQKLISLAEKKQEIVHAVKETEEYIKRMNTVFALESFDNLVKSGRMSKIKGLLATRLGFRGVGIEDDGAIGFKDKVRGSKKAIASIIEDMIQNAFSGEEAVICHCHNPELARRIKEEIEKVWNNVKITIMQTGGLDSYYAELGGVIVSY